MNCEIANNDNNDKGSRVNGGVVPFLDGLNGVLDWSPHTQHRVKRNAKPLHGEDRPCVVKSHILLEVTPLQAEHGGSRGENPEKKST